MQTERNDASPRGTGDLKASFSHREWMAPALVVGLTALATTAPLIVAGVSCGHDFTFHLQSWMDAAAQLRQGAILPRWAFTPAWNAGEPRFLFYPPISWLIGALLEMVLPVGYVALAFTWIALTASGLAMYRLARDFAPPPQSLLASALYLAGPYALFTAYERSAYGELLAAAWLPLLFRAALRAGGPLLATPLPQGSSEPVAPAATALPFALLWLTNAPAAVMGTYAFVFIVLYRFSRQLLHLRRERRDGPLNTYRQVFQPLLRCALSATCGFALAAFYLLPAAYERRWVEIAMAIIPNMRVEDNFLFGHTGDGPHDAVLHTASLLALALLLATTLVLALAWLRPAPRRQAKVEPALPCLAVLAGAIAFLLTSPSHLLWAHLPELAFLQFPWRLLALVSVVLAAALAIGLTRLRLRLPLATAACLVFAAAAGLTANGIFRQGCEIEDAPARRLALFGSGHGFAPTDEYTPADADNDVLRTDNPPFWLAADATKFAPGTRPNPAATLPNYDTPPLTQDTISGRAPSHARLHLATPAILVLNLRAYPAWQVLRGGVPLLPIPRDDGLLAVPLPAGDSTIDLRWRRTPDVLLGDAISAVALLAPALQLGLSGARSRRLRS